MARTIEDRAYKSNKLYYISKTEQKTKQYTNATNLLKSFCQADISRLDAQILIQELTNELLNNFFAVNETQENQDRVLIPILRAGLPMWIAANKFFKIHESSFISCKRKKGTDKVYLNWISKPKLKEKEIILLDTILATGKTISAVCNKIKKLKDKVKTINIMACYASPEAISLLLDNDNINNIYVAVISETINKDGFLIPLTYGDAGDKCFGKTK